MRTDDLGRKFDAIAERAIHEAERMECSLGDFAEGLKAIYLAVKDRWELADDEAGHADE